MSSYHCFYIACHLVSMQHRKDANVVRSLGLLQPLTNGSKLMMKEPILLNSVNLFIFTLSLIFVFILNFVALSILNIMHHIRYSYYYEAYIGD